jgi:integrative and conjugative element protein (TIGR02256 family)
MNFTFAHSQVVLTSECLDDLARHRQGTWLSLENGGQLFARISGAKMTVERISVTRGRSRRTRFGFLPDRAAEQADIDAMFAAGLHYVGDWHTHPEPTPTPSGSDEAKLTDIFRRSTHHLSFMLLVIVGQAEFPSGLYVGAVNGAEMVRGSLANR